MKRLLNSWTAFTALIASPVILSFVLMFGLHWRVEWFTGYPLPILWPV